MTASWTVAENALIGQHIDVNSATQEHKLDTIIRAKHATQGAGEFIYLEGVASTTVGNVVSYDAATFQTALVSIAAGVSRPVAVAMSACVADEYGWYQISGLAVVKKASATSFAAAAALGATSGLAVAAATTLRLTGAVVSSAASGASSLTTVNVMVNRPSGPASD